MSKFYIPAESIEQWVPLLADPIHWKKGYSARTLAHSWHEACSFPVEVQSVLATRFPNIELLLAFPEHKVPLPGGSRPSQNDIWILARSEDKLISIAVEGKVSEPFGPTVQKWRAAASPGKSERLNYLCGQLGIQSDVPDSLRYQLLHRTASAVIEAKRFGADHAIMLVHSFSQSNEWFQDYAEFVSFLGGNAVSNNTIASVGKRSNISLYLSWVCGDAQYLSK